MELATALLVLRGEEQLWPRRTNELGRNSGGTPFGGLVEPLGGRARVAQGARRDRQGVEPLAEERPTIPVLHCPETAIVQKL